MQDSCGFISCVDLSELQFLNSKLIENHFGNGESSFISITLFKNDKNVLIKINNSLLALNRVFYGGILKVNINKFPVKILVYFHNNSVRSNVAASKGGILYINLTKIYHENFSILKYFYFNFSNNRFSNIIAAAGRLIFIEGAPNYKEFENLTNLINFSSKPSYYNQAFDFSNSIFEIKLVSPEKENLNTELNLREKIFDRKDAINFYFCLKFFDYWGQQYFIDNIFDLGPGKSEIKLFENENIITSLSNYNGMV